MRARKPSVWPHLNVPKVGIIVGHVPLVGLGLGARLIQISGTLEGTSGSVNIELITLLYILFKMLEFRTVSVVLVLTI